MHNLMIKIVKSSFFCERHSVGPFILGPSLHLGPMTRFLFLLDMCGLHVVGAQSLTRRRICNSLIQFAVTLGSKSRTTVDHMLLSHLKFPQPGRPGSRIYFPREQGDPVIPLGTGFPFCRLLRLAGTTVEVL
jgi:hypothetical protein